LFQLHQHFRSISSVNFLQNMLLSHKNKIHFDSRTHKKMCSLNYATYFDKAEVLNFKIESGSSEN
jgi:hypothetical protein